jgi:hypothetical protein
MTGAPYLPGFGRCGIPPRWTGSFLLQRFPRSMMICALYGQWSRSVESHICQNRADMGHPSFVTGRERSVRNSGSCEETRTKNMYLESSGIPLKPKPGLNGAPSFPCKRSCAINLKRLWASPVVFVPGTLWRTWGTLRCSFLTRCNSEGLMAYRQASTVTVRKPVPAHASSRSQVAVSVMERSVPSRRWPPSCSRMLLLLLRRWLK